MTFHVKDIFFNHPKKKKRIAKQTTINPETGRNKTKREKKRKKIHTRWAQSRQKTPMQSQWRFIEGCSTRTGGKKKKRRGCVDVVIKTGVVSGDDGTRVDSSKAMQPIATGVVGRFVARSPRKREEKRIGLVLAISGVAHALSPFTWLRPHPITHLMSGQRHQTGNCTRKPDQPHSPCNGNSGKHSRSRQIMKIST